MTDQDPEFLITARGLSRSYGPHRAVAGLDLQLRKGEVLGLLGPNGAGKTTTLNMLTGLLAPDSGEVRIGGIAMAKDPVAARRLLGYLPEHPPLHRELNVREYLAFCARLHGLDRPASRTAVDDALGACGLDEVADQVIDSLSKGYQQRVGIAQAIIHRPPVIILDEPTVGLDPNQMRQIRGLIQQLSTEHALILSSHMLSEVQAVCDRVMILAAGRVVHDGALTQGQDGQAFALRLSFRQPPDPDRLAAFAGVDGVSDLGQGHFQLQIEAGRDPREAIVLQSAALGWGLYELHREQPRLEDVFAELTA